MHITRGSRNLYNLFPLTFIYLEWELIPEGVSPAQITNVFELLSKCVWFLRGGRKSLKRKAKNRGSTSYTPSLPPYFKAPLLSVSNRPNSPHSQISYCFPSSLLVEGALQFTLGFARGRIVLFAALIRPRPQWGAEAKDFAERFTELSAPDGALLRPGGGSLDYIWGTITFN